MAKTTISEDQATGKKTVVQLAAKEPAAEPKAARIDEQLQRPGKYELNPDDEIAIKFSLVRHEGRWLVMEDGTKQQGLETEHHWVRFRMWTFDEEIELRKMATSFDQLKRIHLVDQDGLNRLKVQRLLKSWSFDAENPRLKLLHVNGILSDEGWNAFRKLHPAIARYILDRMNVILEYSG